MIRAREVFLSRYHEIRTTEPADRIARKLAVFSEIYRDFEITQQQFEKRHISVDIFQSLCRSFSSRLETVDQFLERFRHIVRLTENIRAEGGSIINSSRESDRIHGRELHRLLHEMDAWIQSFVLDEEVVVEMAVFRRPERILEKAEATLERALSQPCSVTTAAFTKVEDSEEMARKAAEMMSFIEREAIAAGFSAEVLLGLRNRQDAVVRLLQKERVADALWYANRLHVWLRGMITQNATILDTEECNVSVRRSAS